MIKQAKDKRPSPGQRLIEAMTQVAEALESGDPASYPGVTVHEVEIHEPPVFSPVEIKALRERVGLTQHAFAVVVGGKPLTVRKWEEGRSTPNATARRLLQFIQDSPPQMTSRFITYTRRTAKP